MTNTEILLILNMLPALGNITAKRLIDSCSPLSALLKAPLQLLQKLSLNTKAIESIVNWRRYVNIDQELKGIQKENITIVTILDPEYPLLLKEIYSPPILLYLKGNKKTLNLRNMAIVGSRRPSSYGIEQTQELAKNLAHLGICIVSGLASGIDTAAHKGALDGKGMTIAVLGNGLDSIYPKDNTQLAQSILENNGTLVSEYPLGTPPLRTNFPRRNRIIAGLSEGVIVTEAAAKSGALITADLALEAGRTVFSMPGKINAVTSEGTNCLIKQGAVPLTQARDVIDEMEHFTPCSPDRSSGLKKSLPSLSSLSHHEKIVYTILNDEKQTIDEIKNSVSLPIPAIISTLFSLELKKLIKQLPGKKYVRI